MRSAMDARRAASLLGVPVDASPDQVSAAYRRFVRAHHPDVTGLGADMDEAVRARAALMLGQAAATRRTRTFHRRTPWWRRLMLRR